MAKEGDGRMPEYKGKDAFPDYCVEDAHPDIFTQRDDAAASQVVGNYRRIWRWLTAIIIVGIAMIFLWG